MKWQPKQRPMIDPFVSRHVPMVKGTCSGTQRYWQMSHACTKHIARLVRYKSSWLAQVLALKRSRATGKFCSSASTNTSKFARVNHATVVRKVNMRKEESGKCDVVRAHPIGARHSDNMIFTTHVHVWASCTQRNSSPIYYQQKCGKSNLNGEINKSCSPVWLLCWMPWPDVCDRVEAILIQDIGYVTHECDKILVWSHFLLSSPT